MAYNERFGVDTIFIGKKKYSKLPLNSTINAIFHDINEIKETKDELQKILYKLKNNINDIDSLKYCTTEICNKQSTIKKNIKSIKEESIYIRYIRDEYLTRDNVLISEDDSFISLDEATDFLQKSIKYIDEVDTDIWNKMCKATLIFDTELSNDVNIKEIVYTNFKNPMHFRDEVNIEGYLATDTHVYLFDLVRKSEDDALFNFLPGLNYRFKFYDKEELCDVTKL